MLKFQLPNSKFKFLILLLLLNKKREFYEDEQRKMVLES